MVQIVREPGIGENIGTALGTGLSNLAALKIQQYQQKQQHKNLAQSLGAFGISPDVANSLALLPPELQKAALQNLPALQQFGQAPAAGEVGAGQQQPGINAGELFKSPQMKLAEEKNVIARQKLAQPVFKDIQEKAVPARQLVKYAEDALKNIDKAYTGLRGKITPAYLQSEEGQKLISDLDNIVLLRSQQGKGVPTRMRLILEQGAKAQIWQQPKVIKEILNDILKDPDVLNPIYKDQARSDILEKYGDALPSNFQSLLEKETKKIAHSKTKEKAASFTKESLPAPTNYPEGAKAKNPVTGEYQFIIKNGKWEEI